MNHLAHIQTLFYKGKIVLKTIHNQTFGKTQNFYASKYVLIRDCAFLRLEIRAVEEMYVFIYFLCDRHDYFIILLCPNIIPKHS